MDALKHFLSTFDFNAIPQNIFASLVIKGIVITVILSVISQFAGVVIGLILYFMRRTRFRAVRWIAEGYIWLFRGTPQLVQILFLYTALGYLDLGRALRSIDPFTPLGFYGVFMDSIVAAIIALSLNEGAYMSEIVRAGIDSIDTGQMEAARSLGMTYGLGMRRIVLPQAMRIIIPPLGNEFNNMLKTTSLVSVISLYDLLGAAEAIGRFGFRTLELLVVASIWYLVLTTLWGFVQSWLERRFSASTREPDAAPSLWKRLVGVNRALPRVGLGAPSGGIH
jgi:polar amino acid transport system permease protein